MMLSVFESGCGKGNMNGEGGVYEVLHEGCVADEFVVRVKTGVQS